MMVGRPRRTSTDLLSRSRSEFSPPRYKDLMLPLSTSLNGTFRQTQQFLRETMHRSPIRHWTQNVAASL